ALLIYLGRLIGSLMSIQVKITTEDLESFKRGLPYHRKLAEAIARRDADDAEAMSTALVQMPYDDLARRLRGKEWVRLLFGAPTPPRLAALATPSRGAGEGKTRRCLVSSPSPPEGGRGSG